MLVSAAQPVEQWWNRRRREHAVPGPLAMSRGSAPAGTGPFDRSRPILSGEFSAGRGTDAPCAASECLR